MASRTRGAGRCRKWRYRTEIDAKIALCNVQSKADKGGEKRKERRCYRCPKCRGWHLTST